MSSVTIPTQQPPIRSFSDITGQAIEAPNQTQRRNAKRRADNNQQCASSVEDSTEELLSLAGEERAARSAASVDAASQPRPVRRFPSRIAIRSQRTISFIDAREITSVEAQANYVVIRHKSSDLMVRESISKIAEKLKPYGLVRIHRSCLVNTALVEEIKPLNTGEYLLRVREGKSYIVSRRYKDNLRLLADVWCGVRTGLLK